jgi:tetratricopeptide (TPR) repeat protein
MKSFIIYFLLLCCSLILYSCTSQQQSDQMLITTSSEEAKELYIQGRDKADNIEFTAAMRIFDQALEKDPDFAMAHLQRAQVGGGLEESREHLNKAVGLVDKVSPGEAQFIFYTKALFDGDGSKQKEHLNKLLEILPNDLRVLEQAGIYYYAFVNDFKKALEYYNKATQIDPNFAPPYNMIGYTQVQLKNYDAAEAAFKKYIELVPNSPNSYDSYAEFLLTMGDYDKSIENYQIAYEKDNQYTTALAGIGNNYVLKGDLEKAREYYMKQYEEAVLINEKFGSLFSMILTHAEEGDIDGAIKACESRFKSAEEQNQVQFKISSLNTAGFILAEQGEPEKAASYYEKAAEIIETANLEDADRRSYQYFAGVNHCYILTEQNQLDKATEEGKKCLKIAEQRQNPGELQVIHGQLGSLEIKKGNFQQALEHLKQADPQSPYDWFQMAVAYEGMDMKDKANELFTQVANQNEVRLDLIVVRGKAKDKL